MVKLMINSQEWIIEEVSDNVLNLIDDTADSHFQADKYHICLKNKLSDSKKLFELKNNLARAFSVSFSYGYDVSSRDFDAFDFIALYSEQIVQCAYYCLEHMNDDLKPKETPVVEKE